ncbi:hypothetical protein [Streptomyces sp. NPDC020742]
MNRPIPTTSPSSPTRCDLAEAAHHNSLERIFPRLGGTDTTEAVLRLLG